MMLGGFTGVRWHQPKLHALSYGRSLKTSSNIHCLFDPSNNGSYSMIPGLDNSYTIKLPSIQHLSKIAAATQYKNHQTQTVTAVARSQFSGVYSCTGAMFVERSVFFEIRKRHGNLWTYKCTHTLAGSPPPWGKEFPTFCWIILRKGETWEAEQQQLSALPDLLKRPFPSNPCWHLDAPKPA